MAKVPAKVVERLKKEVPRFQKIISAAQDRDVNEADTVVIITDMLEAVFGMDKYQDVTREFAIKGTFVDLAVKTGSKIDYLIEVKAVGLDLKDHHLRQAVDYAAKEGVRWVILTNGVKWEIHRVRVEGQVTNEQVVDFDFLELSARRHEDLETLFLLCKRGLDKDLIEDFYEHRQACNRFSVGAILTSDSVVGTVRRLLRQITPGLKTSDDEIRAILEDDVIKREVQHSEAGKEAQREVKRKLAKVQKKRAAKSTKSSGPSPGDALD